MYNFSQGQIRLQNAIDNMNKQIEETTDTMKFFLEVEGDSALFDFTEERKQDQTIGMRNVGTNTIYTAYKTDLLYYTDDREDIKKFLEEEPETIESCFINGIETALESMKGCIEPFREAAKKTIATLPGARSLGGWRVDVDKALKGTFNIVTSELRDEIFDWLSADRIAEGRTEEFVQKLEAARVNAENAVERFRALNAMQEKIKGKNKGKFLPNDQERADYDNLVNSFLDAFMEIHRDQAFSTNSFEGKFKYFTNINLEQNLPGDIDVFFAMYPEGRQEFETAFRAVRQMVDTGTDKTDRDAFREKTRQLKIIYQHMITGALQKKKAAFQDADANSETGFLEVMAEVIDEELPKLKSRLGAFDAWHVSREMEGQKKREREIGMDDDEDNPA